MEIKQMLSAAAAAGCMGKFVKKNHFNYSKQYKISTNPPQKMLKSTNIIEYHLP
jgi:hypothetical protein